MLAMIPYVCEIVDAGYQVLSNLPVMALDALHDAWIEVVLGVVGAMVLNLYLARSKRKLFSDKERKQMQSLDERGLRTPCQKACKGAGGAAYKKSSDLKSEDVQKVRKFVASLLCQGSRCTPEVLEQYDELVTERRIDLRRHVGEEHNARSMYIALIGCVSSAKGNVSPSSRHWLSRLLADMRAFGFHRTVEFYASVQKLLINNRLFEDALWLHEVMIKDNITPNMNMYSSSMVAAIACNDDDKALSFFAEGSKLGPPAMRTCMTILRVHSRNKDWKKAVKLLDVMEASGASPDNLALNNVLGLCVSAGQVAIAGNLLNRWKDIVDVVSYNTYLKGCSQLADLPKSEEVLNRMCSEGPAPNLITFNTVMDCAVRTLQFLSNNHRHNQLPAFNSIEVDDDSSAFSPCSASDSASVTAADSRAFSELGRRPWQLLDRLLKLGLEPDRYTCSTLVKGMHLAGSSVSDIDQAVDLLHCIGAEALQPQEASGGSSQGCNARLLEVLFNTLLDACITVKDLGRMEKIFAMMQDFNVNISAVTFGTLIKAFGQAGRISRCREVWAEMQEANIHPTVVTYGCYMDACIRNDDIAAAEEKLQSMRANGQQPNAVIYTSLIRGFASAKQPGKAFEIYRQMRTEGIEATSVTFNSVLDVVARQLAEPDTLQEVLDDMRKANISPDVVTYSILIKASCNAGNVQNALSLFKQIRSHGPIFDQVAFNTLLLACSKAEQISDAEEIFGEMRRLGMVPTHVTTSIMIKMYGKAKMLDKALALGELMEHEYEQKPNLFVYTCLIQACAQNKHVRRSWEIFNRMLQAGVEPDAITYGTVIHGCVYMNKFDYAMSLVRHAYMKPPKEEGKEQDNPFATQAISLGKPVPLQPDVLQMLLSALKRKEQADLFDELELLVSESNLAGNVAKPKATKGSARRRGNGNAAV